MSKEQREKPNKNLGFHHHEKGYDDEKYIDEVKHVHHDYYKRGNKDKVHRAKPPRYISNNNSNNNAENANNQPKENKPTRPLTNREIYKKKRSFSRNKAMRQMQNKNNPKVNRSNNHNNMNLQKVRSENKPVTSNKKNNENKQ